MNKQCTLTVATVVMIFLTVGSVTASPALDATVLVYGADGEPKGTGVLVSPDGIVLTARHVVEDLRMTDAAGRSYYRLKTTLRRQSESQPVPARLIAVHNYLDVAVLQAEFPAKVVSLRIAASPLKGSAPVVLTGHRLPSGNRLLFNQTSGAVKDLDRSGLIVVNVSVPNGYSGGPLVRNGELSGLIRSTDPMAQETFVIPVNAFAPGLAAMGIRVEAGEYARRTGEVLQRVEEEIEQLGTKLREVTAKMDRLQDFYIQSQTEVYWIARLQIEKSAHASAPPELTLELSYEKVRPTQPDLIGSISATVEPIYDDDSYKQWRSQHPGEGRIQIVGTFDELQPSVSKSGIHRELRRIALLHYGNLNLPPGKIRGFQIQSEVEFVTADTSVPDLLKRNICFAIVQSAYESGPLKPMSERGERCLISE